MTRAERKRQQELGVADYVNEIASRLEKFASLQVRRTKRGFWVKQIFDKDTVKPESKKKATKATGGKAEKE
ncbi:MAG: hypothetical protein WCI51_03745 [Lentisphaerota bacterium]